MAEADLLRTEPESWGSSSGVLGSEVLLNVTVPLLDEKSLSCAQPASLWKDESKDGTFTHWPLEQNQPWQSSVRGEKQAF